MTDKIELPSTKAMMEALGDCYTPEFGEIELVVHHTMTEPCCPTAVVRTEEEHVLQWRYDADTIEEAVHGAVAAAYVTLILRKRKPLSVPWTNTGEDASLQRFLDALDRIKDGKSDVG